MEDWDHVALCETLRRTCLCGANILRVALALGAPCLLKAQFTSTLEGRVSDPFDAAVPNAEVTVENQATGVRRVVRSCDVGYYRVASLPPGRFTVRVTVQGFDTAVYEGVLLENDQTKTFNIQLKLGAPTTQVNVTGEAPLVETGEARISGHIQEPAGFAIAAGREELHDPRGHNSRCNGIALRRWPSIRPSHRRHLLRRVRRQFECERPARRVE